MSLELGLQVQYRFPRPGTPVQDLGGWAGEGHTPAASALLLPLSSYTEVFTEASASGHLLCVCWGSGREASDLCRRWHQMHWVLAPALPLQAVRPWASYLTSLHLNLLINKMKIMMVSCHRVLIRASRGNECKVLRDSTHSKFSINASGYYHYYYY